jgi:hypothetical protein
MKVLAADAFCPWCAVFPVAAQVVMVFGEARRSSQNHRLEIFGGGQLQRGANLAVYNADDEQKLSFKADADGMATLPDLPLKITTDQQGHFSASLAGVHYQIAAIDGAPTSNAQTH